MGTAVLYAEAKMGEILKNIPIGKRRHTSKGGTIPTLPEGITRKQSHYAQQIAQNPDLVEKTIAEAEEMEDIPTKREVMEKRL